jgi:putative oxidoreductase
MNTVAIPQSKSQPIVIWALRIILGLLFLFTAFAKLSGQPMMVAEFDTVGLGQWFRYLTGALELVAAIAVLIPTVSAFGALLMVCIAAGAFITQIGVLHMDWIHTLVIALVAGAAVYLQRGQIFARLGR